MIISQHKQQQAHTVEKHHTMTSSSQLTLTEWKRLGWLTLCYGAGVAEQCSHQLPQQSVTADPHRVDGVHPQAHSEQQGVEEWRHANEVESSPLLAHDADNKQRDVKKYYTA